jgi:hypothetical protein
MTTCPVCHSGRVRIIDKGLKKVVRYFKGNNRYACRDCDTTWREKEPYHHLKLRRKRVEE